MQYLDSDFILSAKHCECNIIPLPVNEQVFYAIKRGKTSQVFIGFPDKRVSQLYQMFLPSDKRHIVVEIQLLGNNGKLFSRMHFEMAFVMNNQNLAHRYSVQLGHRVVWED